MPRGFGRLPFRRRRSSASDSDAPAVDLTPIDPDAAPVGPPVLLPAAIIRQRLAEPTDVVPVWARPRPAPEPVVKPAEPAPPKRTRRASSTGATKAARASTKSRSSTTPRQSRRKSGP